MSEYVSKKAVLEHIRREIGITERQRDAVMTRHMKEFHGGAIRALQNLEHTIQSGTFNADESEPDDYESMVLLDAHDQIQRLRAALVEIKQLLNEDRENDGAFQSWNHMQAWKVATQALSTTTEPTGPSISKTQIENIKKMFNDPAYNGIYRSGIFNVLEELGITIPGINAPEGDGNDA